MAPDSQIRWAIRIGSALAVGLGSWFLLCRASPPARLGPHSPSLEAAQAPGQPAGPELRLGSVVRRGAVAGAIQSYTLLLAVGEFLSVDVEQEGVDVSLTLSSPRGELLLVIDSPNGERGTERLRIVAAQSGHYLLGVAVSSASRSGGYTLRVNDLQPATPRDRRRAAAAAVYYEAETQRRRGSGPSLELLTAYRLAAALARQAGDADAEALALRRAAQVADSLGRSREALEDYSASLALYLKGPERWEQALLFFALGRLHRLAGEPREAIEAYSAALERFGAVGDLSRQASTLNDLGLARADLGALQEAIDSYEEALALWRRVENGHFEAVTLKNLGDLYAAMRYHERAITVFGRALALHRREKDELAEAWVLDSLGTVQRRMGAYRQALTSFDRALVLMRRHGDRHGEAAILNSQGATYFKMGAWGQAGSLYRQALDLACAMKMPGIEAYVRVNLGWLEEVRGAPDTALVQHQIALASFRDQGDLWGETSALFGLARAERKRGHLAVAQSWAQAALSKIEVLQSGVANEQARLAFFADRHSYYEFLIDLLMERSEHHREDFAALALQVSERGRAHVLLDLLRSGRVNLARGVAPELLAREQEVEARLQAVELERLRHGQADDGAEVDRTLSSLTGELHDLRAHIRSQNPSYVALTTAEIPTFAEIRRLLGEDTVLLEIALGDERSFLWLVDQDLFIHCTLPPRAEIEAKARRARQLLQVSQVPLFQGQLELVLDDLAKTLLGPVVDQLGDKRLAVVADGVLQLIPFAALPLPAPSRLPGRALIARHEVINLPSIAALNVLREREARRPKAAKSLAVFGDPVFRLDDPRVSLHRSRSFDEDSAETGFSPSWFDSLPSSHREAEAILALVPPSQRLAAIGFDANLERVLEGRLRGFRILHFATHGLLNHRHPDLSGIALSSVREDGTARPAILWAYQIYGLDLPVELVVLSACETALGKELRGEGVIGLTRGFMHAGATRVVVSLWNVSDEGTAELMTRFYRAHLGRGLPAAAALRAAQLSLLAEPRWSAPYYWAGFVLQGDWT